MDYGELLDKYEELKLAYDELSWESGLARSHYSKCEADMLAVRNARLAQHNATLSKDNQALGEMNKQLELAIEVVKNQLHTAKHIQKLEQRELENNHQMAIKEVKRLQGLLTEAENSLDDLQASHNKLEAETISLGRQLELLQAENEQLKQMQSLDTLTRRSRSIT